ncbi:MAG: hypothetical protein DWQ37_23295 [Planctomycetota bacterium]|nr:MAG: hypothetical protein DWQ37_23295 [Planctomycetota bacterium]
MPPPQHHRPRKLSRRPPARHLPPNRPPRSWPNSRPWQQNTGRCWPDFWAASLWAVRFGR